MHPIHARPFHAETDLYALVELHNAVEQAEARPPTLTVERLKQALEVLHIYRYVVDAPGEKGGLAGYGVLFQQHQERCYGDLKVHPIWRRRGIGRELVAALVSNAVELGTRYLAIDLDHTNRAGIRFLLTQGFRFRGDTWALVAPTGTYLPLPDWPTGYSVRPNAEIHDLPMMVSLSNRTFGDLWGHWENTPGLVDETRMAETLDYYDPQGIFIAFDSTGEAVGQCRALAARDAHSDTTSLHVIDQPGVVPEHRAAGLHVPLALAAAHWLRSQAARSIRLESWGDSAATIAGYEALGFKLVEHEVSYVRVLSL